MRTTCTQHGSVRTCEDENRSMSTLTLLEWAVWSVSSTKRIEVWLSSEPILAPTSKTMRSECACPPCIRVRDGGRPRTLST
eukprot:1385174-Amorphochlora_amoeboformis.AAC.1